MDEKRLERIEDKIDRITEKLSQNSQLLARHSLLHEKNTEDLEEHIKRTNLLEESLKPLKQSDTIARACLKGLGVIATCLTILYTLLKLLGL